MTPKIKFKFVGLIKTDITLALLALNVMLLFYLGLLKVKQAHAISVTEFVRKKDNLR